MKYIKEYNDFVLNEEKGILRNLILSAMLSLGLNSADAQTIQSDSIKKEVVLDIANFNKSIIYNLHPDRQIPYNNLKRDLSMKIYEPEIFIDKYLKLQQDGTLIVRPEFIKGLEFHINKNNFELDYKFEF